MYNTDIFSFSWGWQPIIVRLVLLTQMALILIAAARFVNSARHLYRASGRRISLENVLKGEVAPDALAAADLASWLRIPVQGGPDSFESSSDRLIAEPVLHTLGLAECRFVYSWEICSSDVESARRASLLAFLLSLAMVAFAASPIYFGCFNESNLTGATCLFRTAWHVLVLLALGWSSSAVLYFLSSFFARALAKRRANWRYFCARARSELVRER
jgi:hypothetical protein